MCALLSGGGYAERVARPAGQLMPVPAGVDLVDAAALPEVTCTVWSNLVHDRRAAAGRAAAGARRRVGGIGTMAIQVGRAMWRKVATTAGSAEKLAACADLGAQILINYRDEDFVGGPGATDGRGADVMLDIMGGEYLRPERATRSPPKDGWSSSACRAAPRASSTSARCCASGRR